MSNDDEEIVRLVVGFLVAGLLVLVIIFISFHLLYKPLRNRERLRLFLDLLERNLKQGRSVEQSMVLMAESGERSLGVEFYLVAANIEKGLTFADILAKYPKFLPQKIRAILKAGIETGNLVHVLPVARQTLTASQSEARGNENFLLSICFTGGPAAVSVLFMLSIFVVPKLKYIFDDEVADAVVFPAYCEYVINNPMLWVMAAVALTLVTWLAAWLHSGEPAGLRWLEVEMFPVKSWQEMILPWKRKRMLRDFSAILALLLDAGLPEEKALRVAGDSTANWHFQKRVENAIQKLQAGQKLTEAVAQLDDSVDFSWRLENAKHSPVGFRVALAGWLESLAAKAYQQEQTSAQVITSILLLLNGALIGSIIVAVFMMLTSIIEASTLW
ncbi:MAG: type II secretion system F family protein [Verrucomicrobiota bacterium]